MVLSLFSSFGSLSIFTQILLLLYLYSICKTNDLMICIFSLLPFPVHMLVIISPTTVHNIYPRRSFTDTVFSQQKQIDSTFASSNGCYWNWKTQFCRELVNKWCQDDENLRVFPNLWIITNSNSPKTQVKIKLFRELTDECCRYAST